jgi:GNAT superfamily N-acetyltransferase
MYHMRWSRRKLASPAFHELARRSVGVQRATRIPERTWYCSETFIVDHMSMVPDFVGLSPLGFAAKTLRANHERDVTDVTEFCRKCSSFFALVASESDADETARNLLEARPPGVEPARKHVVGIQRGSECVAIVDLLEDFPRKAEWYVGLLLLLPEERNRGLGRAVWNSMEPWMRSQGGRLTRLIVQEQNPCAARFWRSVGFNADGQVEQVLASRTNLCWRFEKQLTAPVHQETDH